jgi:transcriptional regulator with XRE-family HTH domain
MAGLRLTKRELAERLGLSRSRVSQLVAAGLPVEPDGKVDAVEAARWVLANLYGLKAEPMRQAAWKLIAAARAKPSGLAPALDFAEPLHQGFAVAALLSLREAPIAATLALAEVGLSRAQAERAADLLLVLLWRALNEHANALGVPDMDSDGPIYAATDMLAWRDAVNWPVLFGPDGASLVAGRIEAESREELAAELAEVEAAEAEGEWPE